MLDYKTHSDEELVDLVRQNDRAAFTELYNRFSGILYIYTRKITQDNEVTEDILQDIFISIWDRRQSFVLKGTLSAYLYKAVRYKFFDLLARQKIRADYAERFQKFIDENDQPTDAHLIEKELIELIEREISKLPEKMREVFELSRHQGLSHKEIAQQLNISEKTVKNQVNNALKILRRKLGAFVYSLMFF